MPDMPLVSALFIMLASSCLAALPSTHPELSHPLLKHTQSAKPKSWLVKEVSEAPRMSLRGGLVNVPRLGKGGGEDLTDDGNLTSDLNGDGGVIKTTVQRGLGGGKPLPNDEVFVNFNATIVSINEGETVWEGKEVGGQLFDSNMLREKVPRGMKLDETGGLVKGLAMALMSMTKGEKSTVTIRPDYAFGKLGKQLHNGAFIPPNATLKYEIEVLRWNERDIFNDGGVLVASIKKPEGKESFGAAWRHPQSCDEVCVSIVGSCDGHIFAETNGSEWVPLGCDQLIPGLEAAIVREGILGGTFNCTVGPSYAYGVQGMPPHVPPGATVQFTVMLHDWNTVHDRFRDGSLVITSFGQADDAYAAAAKDCSKINVTIEGRTKSGQVFLPKQAFTDITVGNRVLPDALETAFELIQVRQKYKVAIRAELFTPEEVAKLEYGKYLNQDVEFEVEVTSIRRPFQLTPTERIDAAFVRKELGNSLFMNKRYEDAMYKYDQGFQVVRFLQNHEEGNALKVTLHLNKAACLQKLAKGPEEWKSIVSECTQALDIRSHSVKALYRRAQAYMHLNDLVEARFDIKKVLELDPENVHARAIMTNLVAEERKLKLKDKAMFSKMFPKNASITKGKGRDIQEDRSSLKPQLKSHHPRQRTVHSKETHLADSREPVEDRQRSGGPVQIFRNALGVVKSFGAGVVGIGAGMFDGLQQVFMDSFIAPCVSIFEFSGRIGRGIVGDKRMLVGTLGTALMGLTVVLINKGGVRLDPSTLLPRLPLPPKLPWRRRKIIDDLLLSPERVQGKLSSDWGEAYTGAEGEMLDSTKQDRAIGDHRPKALRKMKESTQRPLTPSEINTLVEGEEEEKVPPGKLQNLNLGL